MKPRLFRVLGSLILIAAALITSPASPARAATHTVTNTNDSGPGSLREAVGMAGDGDTILFSGVSGTILLVSPIEIYNSITLTGPGSSVLAVSGGDLVRVFRVSGENVTISGLTVTHGYVADEYGGGILHWQGTLTLEDVAVTHNQALKVNSVGFGGGIANYSGTLVMTNGSLAYNTANNMGGGLFSYFGAGLTMTNVVVDHNQALADSGGGLGIRGVSTGQTALPVTLDRVSITDNSADYSAGGLYSDASLAITNSLIAGNTSTGSGGGGGMHFNDTGTGALPVTINLTNTTIAGNTSAGTGGLNFSLVKPGSSATLNNVTIANNQIPTSGSGAGIYHGGPAPVNLENSLLAGNLTNGAPDDCNGTLVSLDYNLLQDTSHCTITGQAGHNLTGVSAQLADLADNGGPTRSMALLPASPARDAGNDLSCAITDQRGVARPQGAHCDMGAYELVQYSLHVNKAGTGTGLVSSDPPGLDCGLACAYDFPENMLVTLTAVPSAGSAFDGWSGETCLGQGTCTLGMDAARSVVASFSLITTRSYLPLVVR